MGKIKYIKIEGIGDASDDVVDHLKKKQEKRKFKDTGDYVDGSAKERAAIRSLVSSADLTMIENDEATAISMVVKDNVWPPYDFDAERENGIAPSMAFFKNEMRKAFPPKPIKDNADMRRVYVSAAEYLQQELNKLKEIPQHIEGFLYKTFFGYNGLLSFTTGYQLVNLIEDRVENDDYFEAYRPVNDLQDFIKKNYFLFDDYFYHYAAKRTLREALEDNFGKGRFINLIGLYPVKTMNDLLNKSLSLNDDNWSWSETKKRGETTKSDKIEVNTGVPLSYIKRKGGLLVDNGDISEHTLTESLGFRAVQLGHAITDKELAQHIRHFICSITDLGEALDLDMQRTHDLGELAISFAARGKSKAMAHYEPLRKIINLTRSRGDGSVAHEWGHFFDHLVGRSMKLTTGKLGSEIFVYDNKRKALQHNTTLKADNITQIREVFDRLQAIHRFIFKGNGHTSITKRFYAKDGNKTFGFDYGNNPEQAIANLRLKYPSYFTLPFRHANALRVFSSIAHQYDLTHVDVDMTLVGWSKYYYESFSYGSKYWASPVELFARAFECFVFDRLSEKDMENNYLVSGGHFNRSVYPQGTERIELNVLFGELIEAVRKHLKLGNFVPRTTTRVDEFIELADNGDADKGTVFVDEQSNDEKQTKKLKNNKTKNIGVALALAIAIEIEMEMEFEFDVSPSPNNTSTTDNAMAFVEKMRQEINLKVNHNKTTVEKLGKTFGIDNQNQVKELTELAIVLEARKIAENRTIRLRDRFDAIVDLYKSQVNLSHRTSMSILMQQYSTSAPISYLAGMWVKSHNPDAAYFEPSAGNGLLCHALPYHLTHVNELDEIRLANLHRQPFKTITNRDASMAFGYGRIFDGIITNPPFGDLEDVELVDGFHIKKLEHIMALRALDTMKDDGRAAIIVGGHTRYDNASGSITNKGDRYFLNYLYHNYNVVDIVPIDGHKLYSRQGTAFDTRLILIAGRKETPSGIAEYAPLEGGKQAHLREVMDDFDCLFTRIINNDINHFMEVEKKGEPQKQRFKPNANVSFIGAGTLVCTGVVVRYHQNNVVEVKYNKNTITLPESHLVPALISCSVEKPTQGYKAFKSIAHKTNSKTWIAKFIDGETMHVSHVFSNKEAQEKAIRARIKATN
jgi:hypothetical protein